MNPRHLYWHVVLVSFFSAAYFSAPAGASEGTARGAADATTKNVVPEKAPCGELITIRNQLNIVPSEKLRKRLASIAWMKTYGEREQVIRAVLTDAQAELGDKHPFVAVCLYELAANYCPPNIMVTPKTDDHWNNVNMKPGEFETRTKEAMAEFESRKKEASEWIAQADSISDTAVQMKDPCCVADEYLSLYEFQRWGSFENGAKTRFQSVASNSSCSNLSRRHALNRLALLASQDAHRFASIQFMTEALQKARVLVLEEKKLEGTAEDEESRFANKLQSTIDAEISRWDQTFNRSKND